MHAHERGECDEKAGRGTANHVTARDTSAACRCSVNVLRVCYPWHAGCAGRRTRSECVRPLSRYLQPDQPQGTAAVGAVAWFYLRTRSIPARVCREIQLIRHPTTLFVQACMHSRNLFRSVGWLQVSRFVSGATSAMFT